MPAGLVESEKLPTPIFTPSTKADQGEHDENIHPDKGELVTASTLCVIELTTPVKDICGVELAAEIEQVALRLYSESCSSRAGTSG
jgi:phosphoribosylaminoimidazole-succinocarboxamide synthase